jgi:type II secretory pathway pseudopilin PulG
MNDSTALPAMSAPRRARRTRMTGRGFTILEVLIGVLMLTIGIVAIFAMQATAIQTNRASYDLRAATELAETTLERIQRDSLMWGQSGNPGDWGAGSWLVSALSTTATDGTFGWPPRPANVTGGRQPTFNDLGLSADDVSTVRDARGRNSRFCVDYVAEWLRAPTFARVTVRVRWARNRLGEQALRNDCTRMIPLTEAVQRQNFYEVRTTGVVRMPQ